MSMKTLCKLKSKEIEKNLRYSIKVVARPWYVCEKCGRASRDKKQLCKPVKIVQFSALRGDRGSTA